jgi:LAO/AO transport system kinase
LKREIRSMMEMLDFSGWVPELVMTQATSGEGVDDLWAAIQKHVAYLQHSGEMEAKRREAFTHQVRQLALGHLQRKLERELESEVAAGVDPYAAAERVLQNFGVKPEAVDEPIRPPHIRASVKGLM